MQHDQADEELRGSPALTVRPLPWTCRTWNSISGGRRQRLLARHLHLQDAVCGAAFDKEQQVWLQFEGVNASAKVTLNGVEIARHDGGYTLPRGCRRCWPTAMS